jgi:ribosome biogenesis GTPase
LPAAPLIGYDEATPGLALLMNKKKKIRVDMRKNRTSPPRQRRWTRDYDDHGFDNKDPVAQERIRAKGDISRRRTIIADDGPAQPGKDSAEMPAVDTLSCLPGRVLSVRGLLSIVETDDGRQFRCSVRRVLRTMATDERSLVATGDKVWILPTLNAEGVIERVEPRHGLLTRASRGREHVIVANVDQVVFVVSLREPDLKRHLVDRLLASAEQGKVAPIVCFNKADLVDTADYQSLAGLYSQLGIPMLFTSTVNGLGIKRLGELLRGKETVFSGQSGVGKSSLLNAIQPDFELRIREVSEVNQKGKHTTTTAELIKLQMGGWVVDTPGIRQFQLWDIIPEEMEGYFPEFRPYVHLCTYPDCTHTHEDRCAIKHAVALGRLSDQRYASYLGLFEGAQPE